jgi:proteasome accessory factor A
MLRRIFGLETEYGITCTLRGQRRLTPDEVARYLFRSVVAWGRSSNVFLENGGRLYLDVGSHPEFATPECDSILDVVRFDRAGDLILHDLVENAESRLRNEGIRGTIYLFKNNTDSAGNSYGCHENYLVRRATEPDDYQSSFIPFLVSRQIYAGAGKILTTPKGPVYALSQRAEHIWEDVSSATTRSRPIINTRDEPHADAEEYRRLHVIVGDSNMNEYATFLKVGTAACMLRMLETEPHLFADLTLENPIRAIREISGDITCRRQVRLKNGREMSAFDLQSYYLECALKFETRHGFDPLETDALREWETVMTALGSDASVLKDRIDWVTKLDILDRYCEKNDVGLDSAKCLAIDLQYHDINPDRGIFNKLVAHGSARSLIDGREIHDAKSTAPSTTRAHLRGEFIRQAKAKSRDFTVDWVHLKLNEQIQRTVVCKDPFASTDERVDRLIASL